MQNGQAVASPMQQCEAETGHPTDQGAADWAVYRIRRTQTVYRFRHCIKAGVLTLQPASTLSMLLVPFAAQNAVQQ